MNNVQITITEYDYKRLQEKANEFDEPISTIIEWLVEEHLDEIVND